MTHQPLDRPPGLVPLQAPAPPEPRRTSPEEIARVTGWSLRSVHRAIKGSLLPGCLFVPAETNANTGTYLCAWAPFAVWWAGQASYQPTMTDLTATDLVRRVQAVERAEQSIRELAV